MTNLEKLKQLIKLDCVKDFELIEILKQHNLKSDNTYKIKDELKLLKITLQELDKLSDHIELESEIRETIDRIREIESENIFLKIKRLISK